MTATNQANERKSPCSHGVNIHHGHICFDCIAEAHAYPDSTVRSQSGLTKRELFAAMAMQGWLSGCANAYHEFTNFDNGAEPMAGACVKFADALLAALETP